MSKKELGEHRERLRKAIDDMENTEVCLDIFDRTVKYIEREVWEKVCAEMQSRHLSSASSGPDDRAASAAIEVYKCMEVWCREQQKGVEG